MTQKVAVAIVHGIGRQEPGFYEKMKAEIENNIHNAREWRLIYELADYPDVWDRSTPNPPFVDDPLKMMIFFNKSSGCSKI